MPPSPTCGEHYPGVLEYPYMREHQKILISIDSDELFKI